MESGVAMSGGLASVPAGPALCARLSQLEAGAVEDEPLLALLSAEARQLGYQQARVWAVLTEIAHRDPMPAAVPRLSPEQVFDSAVEEIRAELLLTRRGAARELEHADTVCAQPRVFAALQRGEIDRARFAVEPNSYLRMFPEIQLAPEDQGVGRGSHRLHRRRRHGQEAASRSATS